MGLYTMERAAILERVDKAGLLDIFKGGN